MGNPELPPWLALLGLWTALNHPKNGAVMRKAVSAKLREAGKAHITWCLSSSGLALALCEGFVDLSPLSAAAPRDHVTLFVREPDDAEEPGH